MQITDPIDVESVVLAVAESELFSRRFALGLGTHMSEALNERLRYAPAEEWSPADRHELAEALRDLHPSLLDPLLRMDVQWFHGVLDAADLPDLRTVATREFQDVSPDRRLATLVASLERGKDTLDAEFSGAYRRLRRDFRPAQWRGRPCLVAQGREGPFTVLEGLTRLAVVLALSDAGRPTLLPVAVYVGLTDALAEWGFAAELVTSGSGDLAGGRAPAPSSG